MENRILSAAGLTAFRRALIRRVKSPATVAKYLHDARAFAAWAGGAPVTPEKVSGWKKELSAIHKPATVNGKLAAVNALFSFLRWEECRVRALKVQRRAFREDARELTRAEFRRLVQAALRQGKTRLALLLETLGATGVRVSETQYITVEAARLGMAEIALKGKIRTVLLPGKLCRKLVKYARKQKIASGAIFRTRSGKILNRKQNWAEMKVLCKEAGVSPGKVFPHNLRHLFARAFYRATRDIVKLADILGHASLSTTRIYLISTGSEHRRELEKLRLVC